MFIGGKIGSLQNPTGRSGGTEEVLDAALMVEGVTRVAPLEVG